MFIQLKNQVAFVLENARWRALPQSFISCILAICIALNAKQFAPLNAILATLGVLSAHLSANLFDDYFDFIQGKVEVRNKVKGARGLKCANILNGSATVNDFLIWAICFGSVAALIGLYFVFTIGFPIIYFIIAGGFLAIFYSAPPFKLSYRGLGELVIGLMFGFLLVCGVYYVSTGEINQDALLLSFASGLLATNIVYVHSMMDINADTACQKLTLAGVLKTKPLQITALCLFTFLPYILGFLVSKTLGLVLLSTFPIAAYLIYVMNDSKRHKILFRTLPKRSWKFVLKTNYDYFITRWLLARNFMTIFIGIICVFYIIKAVK